MTVDCYSVGNYGHVFYYVVKIVIPRVLVTVKESIARCPQSDGLCRDACPYITRALRCGPASLFEDMTTLRTPLRCVTLTVTVDPTTNWNLHVACRFGVFT